MGLSCVTVNPEGIKREGLYGLWTPLLYSAVAETNPN
jgi:hypothetical protein